MTGGEVRERAQDVAVPIGEFARRSGMSVSALRFYDGEGVLRPDAVDATSGYRRYAIAQLRVARLVAGMRRIGMPIAEIREAVEHADDAEAITGLLDTHLSRLESGLADARREIGHLRATLADSPGPVRIGVAPAGLRRLIEAVRCAMSRDPEMPILQGALLEVAPDVVRLVATDRYRLAVHEIAAEGGGSATGVLPAGFLEDLDAALARHNSGRAVVLHLEADSIHTEVDGRLIESSLLAGAYPDYRRILADPEAGEIPWTDELVSVDVPARGLATLTAHDHPVVVRHEFLLDALGVAGSDATLRLDGPIAPLAIRAPDGALSLLMPTRPEVDS